MRYSRSTGVVLYYVIPANRETLPDMRLGTGGIGEHLVVVAKGEIIVGGNILLEVKYSYLKSITQIVLRVTSSNEVVFLVNSVRTDHVVIAQYTAL